MAHKWVDWLHNPCHLGSPQCFTTADNIKMAHKWADRLHNPCHLPTAAGRAPRANLRRDLDSDGETWTPTTTWELARVPAQLASGTDPRGEEPRMADRPEDPQADQEWPTNGLSGSITAAN